MKVRLMLCTLLVWFVPENIIFAQGQNNIWTMGHGLGLDFNGGGPVFYSSKTETWEGCASVCDPMGKLLFYSDGINVYDRTHTVMPNGSGMLGDVSTTQGVAICRVMGQDSVYFLFTLSDYGVSALCYSIVDMRLHAGLGDVDPVMKNVFVKDRLSEKMIVAGFCDKQWLLVHHRDSNFFYAYPLDSSTALSPPVVSRVGGGSSFLAYATGELKVAADMATLAMANHNLELYDFDKFTGIVSNYRLLDSLSSGIYSVEFSSDGSKLYSSAIWGGMLYQYNLRAGSLAAIRASRYVVYPGRSFGLRRGPDNMIYVVLFNLPNNFSRIRNPNLSGVLCNFQKDFLPAPFVNSKYCYGFGNNFFFSAGADTIRTTMSKNICSGDTLRLSGSGYKDYYWSDSSRDSVKVIYGTSGTFVLYSVTGCAVKIDSFSINALPSVNSRTRKDTFMCLPGFLSLRARAEADSVLWNDGSKGMELTIASGGTYWVRSYSKCGMSVDTSVVKALLLHKELIIQDTLVCFRQGLKISAPDTFTAYTWGNGSTRKDTTVQESGRFTVVARDELKCNMLTLVTNVLFLTPPALRDISTCLQDSVMLDASTTYSSATYEWSTGERTPQVKVLPPATRFVFVRVGSCTLYDTIRVEQRSLGLNIGGNQTVCEGKTLTLHANISGYKYGWSTGATGPEIEVSQAGTYVLKAYNDTCSESAEVQVSFVNCSACAAVPNAFTPNNDGINDRFKPVLTCPVLEYELSVRNRWGQLLFTTYSPNEGWDGSANGSTLEGNVYYYMLKVKFNAQDGKEQLYKGDVTLIR